MSGFLLSKAVGDFFCGGSLLTGISLGRLSTIPDRSSGSSCCPQLKHAEIVRLAILFLNPTFVLHLGHRRFTTVNYHSASQSFP